MSKKLVVGILAHVDAGKTTLSEAMLYRCGCLRKLGRVDHADAFLDTDVQERERGITIFSKQAILPLEELEITLLDTPGHVDFSSEMERALQVMDCAILVVSGADGVQGHTETLWRLLERHHIPTILFVNKMDQPGTSCAALLSALKQRFGEACVDFSGAEGEEAFFENIALCEEAALSSYLERGRLEDAEIAALVARRQLFPCWFGSALKLTGVDELLRGLEHYVRPPEYPAAFAARVFKIARDSQGSRLTYLKITGGSLRTKEMVTNRRAGISEEGIWEEKADQIRIYSGAKFRPVDEAEAGTVCAVTGLSRTYAGEALGGENAGEPPALESVFTYRVLLPEGCDPHSALLKLRELEEEDPQLHLSWNAQLREIRVQLMGAVQMEVLERLIARRFGLAVTFALAGIVYRETIADAVEGVGHFEPLRHYAEVHLLLEPGQRGSGLRFAAACPEDMLDRNWQRLILTHLEEKTHLGVLTGSPITDMKITLTAGRAHVKHTEGGDFRQATYRAVRQGLMSTRSILLEPWYDFRLELPTAQLGRALTDLQHFSARVEPPVPQGETALLAGSAPAVCLQEYGAEVIAYTKGRGRLTCTLKGYEPCHNQDEVAAALAYDSERDAENPADSIFCAHGAGFLVKWDRVREHMHVESGLRQGKDDPEEPVRPAGFRAESYSGTLEQDKELRAIFERTYGPVRRRDFISPRETGEQRASLPERRSVPDRLSGPEYLLVDGYNIIFAWNELKAVARDNLDAARGLLLDLLSNYQGFRHCEVIVVFDAYKVPHGTGEVSRYHNIHVVYTKEAETADAYIERATYDLGREHRVRVATSDGAEQLIILGHGALRLSARAFRAEVEQIGGQITAILTENNRKNRPVSLRDTPAGARLAQDRKKSEERY